MSATKAVRGKSKRKGKKATGITAHKTLLAWLLGLSTLIGGAAAALALLPRPSVALSEQPDPQNSMSASFTIANNNFVPLWHVTAEVALGYISTFPPDQSATRTMKPEFATLGPRLVRPEWKDHTLNMDDRFTVTPSDLFANAKEGEIAIVVLYQPWILPLQREKVFRFLTHKETNGNLSWYSLPSN